MRLAIPRCPKCNDPAASIVERVLVTAYISLNKNGTHSYGLNGCTVDWDSQKPLLHVVDGERAFAKVQCENEHEWQTKVTEQ
jgi:hypothetical protein